LSIPEDIPGPVYVYYQLDNFYQNHRRYVKSRSFSQLNGKYLEKGDLKDCDPIILNKDLGPNITFAADKVTKLDPEKPAVPCGLVAKSFFNDTYKILASDDAPITINEKDISW
jgi:hypothetical protein